MLAKGWVEDRFCIAIHRIQIYQECLTLAYNLLTVSQVFLSPQLGEDEKKLIMLEVDFMPVESDSLWSYMHSLPSSVKLWYNP